MFSSRIKSIAVRSAIVLTGAAASVSMVAGTSGAAVTDIKGGDGVSVCNGLPLTALVDGPGEVKFFDNNAQGKGLFSNDTQAPTKPGAHGVTTLWTPKTPGLHRIKVTHKVGNKTVDRIKDINVLNGFNTGSGCIPLP